MNQPSHDWQPDQPPPPPGTYAAAPPQKKHWFLRHKFLTLLLGVMVIGGISIASSTGGSSDTETATGADESAAPADDAGDKKPAKDEEESKSPGKGSRVRDGKFEFVVTKVESGKSQIGGTEFGETAQGQFVLVTMKVTNIGDESRDLADSNQKLFDTGGRSYEADSMAAVMLPNNKVLFETINPGNTVTGTLVFDMPKGSQPGKIELHDSMLSGGVTVTL